MYIKGKQRFFQKTLCIVMALCITLPIGGGAVLATGGAWYDTESVNICLDSKLMQGNGQDFNPSGILTVAETAVIAARLYEKMTGEEILNPSPGQDWYEAAINLMYSTGGILEDTQDPLLPVTRAGFIRAISTGIPLFGMPLLNNISKLPDTGDKIIIQFYNVGILTGVDKYGTFASDRTLTRAEAAAVVARIVAADKRVRFDPEPPSDELISSLLANYMDTHPKAYIFPDKIVSTALSPELLEYALSLANVKADETMLSIGNITVSAKQYLPVILCQTSLLWDALPSDSGVEPSAQVMLRETLSSMAKQQAVNACIAAIFEMNGATITEENCSSYLIDYPASESNKLNEMDILRFYEDFVSGDYGNS